MKQVVAGLVGIFIGGVVASSAGACTMLTASYQQQLGFQQAIWSRADSVFLANATPVDDARSNLSPMATIRGAAPPDRSSVRVLTNCGDRPPERTVIAFGRRLGLGDVQWRLWRLGEWTVSYIYPNEVVDPVLVSALRDAADRLGEDAR